jgi:Flp pilus assembly protein TadG
MKRLVAQKSDRKGAVTPLVALLLIPLLAMAAFAIDIGWIVLAQSDLQNAADATALAGAQQLIGQEQLNSTSGLYSLKNGYADYYAPGVLPTQQATILSTATAAAKTSAKNFASYHSAGTVSALALNDSDIEFGFTDSSGNYTASPTYAGYPNTIKVVLRLDSQANGSLPLFFGPVLGTKTSDIAVTASATIYTGTVNSLNINPNYRSRILPMTYDVNDWNTFLQTGLGPDGADPAGPAANGAPQLQVYPSTKDTGNFGLLSMDQSSDGASTIAGWIDSGVPSTDLQQELNDHLLPLSSHDSTKWDWKGNSGLKTDDIHALSSHVGDVYLIPLFKPYNPGVPLPTTYAAGTGNGTNYDYNIVKFAAVRISYVDDGGTKSVHVQPAAYIDPNAIFSNVTPAAAPPLLSSSLVTTFTSPKLTR